MIEDITEVKRAEHAQRFLAQAGAVLASSLDYEQTLNRIARLAVPRLADWCSVTHARAATALQTRRRRARRPGQARVRPRVPGALSDRRSTPHRRRAACCARAVPQVVNDIDDELLDARSSRPGAAREPRRRLGLRA